MQVDTLPCSIYNICIPTKPLHTLTKYPFLSFVACTQIIHLRDAVRFMGVRGEDKKTALSGYGLSQLGMQIKPRNEMDEE